MATPHALPPRPFRNRIHAALLLALAGAGPVFAQAPPNVVFILADDMGLGDLSAYNPDSKISTPAMDRLASEGMRFTDAHSNSAVCTPTRYGILTGRYAWRSRLKSGVLDGGSPSLIEPGRLTVGDLFKSKGYKTACIGKWHLGLDFDGAVDWGKAFKSGPTAKGFDYFYGISASLDMPPYVFLENDRALKLPDSAIAASPWPAFWREGGIAKGFTHRGLLPALADRAAAYLGERKAQPKVPFFLYLPLASPHTPHIPPLSMVGKSQAGARGDMVWATDWAVGRVLAALDSLGLAANTLVVLTADNGAHDRTYQANGHTPHLRYRGQKADIFEAGHRVPLIVRWPGVVKAGSRSTETACLTDFMATSAAVLGIRLPETAGEDSYSLLPVLLGKTLSGPLREATVHHSKEGIFALRKGKWKLSVDDKGSGGFTEPVTAAGPGTLFDLAANPSELEGQDRYAAESAVVAELRALLASYKSSGRSTPKDRKDEFWQGPTGAPGNLPGTGARWTLAGRDLDLRGVGPGRATLRLLALDGRLAWTAAGTGGPDGIRFRLPPLESGLYGLRVDGPGINLRDRVLLP